MNLRSAGVVFRKELTDTLRDHRFLISSILVPILIFPVLMLGITGLATLLVVRARGQAQRVMILGAEHAPELARRLENTKVEARGFGGMTLVAVETVPPSPDYVRLINEKSLQAAVELPERLEERLRANATEVQTIKIYHYEDEIRSRAAVGALRKDINKFIEERVAGRLTTRGLSLEWLTPFQFEESNVAPAEKVSGNLLGLILPYFIIILCLTGAMYPAMDLTAGEKERGTIETILASPARRVDLVLGKFFLVLTVSLITTALSLASFAGTVLLGAQIFRRLSPNLVLVVSAKSIAAVFFIVLPLAVFFSAALIAISILARNYKEAQSYIGPLMFLAIFPAMASFIPGVELNARLALIPVLNMSLVSREIFAGQYPWDLIGVIFGSTWVYAGVALYFAARQFEREEVLFRT